MINCCKLFITNLTIYSICKNTINTYLNEHPECKYYVLTNPDIELDEINGDIIEFYMHCLEGLKCNSVIPIFKSLIITGMHPLYNTHDKLPGHPQPSMQL